MYDNWYDAVHRYRMRLPHHPNSTHDDAGNDVVEQDMYWDDDSDKPYEAYMDHWCGMVYPQGDSLLPFSQVCCLSFSSAASERKVWTNGVWPFRHCTAS